MNNSPLSEYKSNSSGVSGLYPGAYIKKDSEKVQGAYTSTDLSHQSENRIELKEGQVIKGEVIDLRYQEVKVRLEPGSQTVTAKLSGDIPLAIGQEAHFQVTQGMPGQITLKYLPEENQPTTDPTVKMALEASGLASTQRNREIVQELMNNQLPIDRQTLQMLVRISNMNRDASPLSLVLMYKNNIPMTPENINQFESYQNGAYQILNDIHAITDNIAQIFRNFTLIYPGTDTYGNQFTGTYEPQKQGLSNHISSNINTASSDQQNTDKLYTGTDYNKQADTTAASNILSNTNNKNAGQPVVKEAFLQQNIDVFQSQPKSDNTLNGQVLKITEFNDRLIEILKQGTGYDKELNILDTKIGSLIGKDETLLLFRELYQKASESTLDFGSMQNSLKQLQDGTISLSEIMRLITKLYGQDSSAQDGTVYSKASAFVPPDNPAAPVISNLIERYSQMADNQKNADSILTPDEKTALLEFIQKFPDSGDMKSKVSAGTASAFEILDFINKQLHGLNTSETVRLLEAPEYSKLLEEAFHQKWTISPEKLSDKSSLNKLYQNLQEDLEKLSNLADFSRKSAESLHFQEPVKNLQNNLQFMKALNEVLTYVQLPIQFKNQDVHGDLYLFAKKKALRDKKDTLTILLHLDMANLGPLNIHMSMEQNMIQAAFYPADKASADIISEHLPELIQTLSDKGYRFQARVEKTAEQIDFIKDILGNSTPESHVQRYSFDIRA